MAILCGWASQSEKGGINGTKGDQTGKEVRTGPWYYFGQNVVLRFKDRSKAKLAAKYMQEVCDNPKVGYGQYDRLSLYYAWKAAGWSNPQKIHTACNTDCSQLVSDCVIAVGYEIAPTNWTGSLKAALLSTGGFEALTESKYLGSDKYLMVGDIVLNEKSHVIMALQNGSGVTEPTAKKKSNATIAKEVIAGKWGVGNTRYTRLKAAGYDPDKVQAEVNKQLKGTTKKLSTTALAKEIIAGKWGVGDNRVRLLKSKGYTNAEIAAAQNKVNQMMR